eukprot:TRINITY_DN5666_c0_g1_i1.p1 TRINITY_DN5666_c0_g1~~TRINITY_DN5666_c0_g1_i1.p1  ORF type:complete len:512 (-),score=78.09 TRINITY_DN5666_c0_g1_i1:56-1591(-)
MSDNGSSSLSDYLPSWANNKWVLGSVALVSIAGAYVVWDVKKESKIQRIADLTEANILFRKGKKSHEKQDYKSATLHYTKCILLLDKYFPHTDDNLLEVRSSLFQCLLSLYSLREARDCGWDLLSSIITKYGKKSMESVGIILDLFPLQVGTKPKVATELLNRAEVILEENNLKDSFLGLRSILCRYLIASTNKEWDNAESTLLKAKELISKKDSKSFFPTLDEKAKYTVQIWCGLAKIKTKQDNLTEAEEYFVDLVEQIRKDYGEPHLSTALVMRNLADFYEKHNRFEDAERVHKEVLEYINTIKEIKQDDIFTFTYHLCQYYFDNFPKNEDYIQKGNDLLVELKSMDCKMLRYNQSKYFNSIHPQVSFVPVAAMPGESEEAIVRPILLVNLSPTKKYENHKNRLYVEIEFENGNLAEEDPEKNVWTRDAKVNTKDGVIRAVSEPLDGELEIGKCYDVIAHVWKDKTKTLKLAEHHQLIRSLVDTNRVKTTIDLKELLVAMQGGESDELD